MRVLILGVTGQDGLILASKLQSSPNLRVFGTTRRSIANLDRQLGLPLSQFITCIQLNPEQKNDLLSLIEQVQPDQIFVLAGQSSVGLSFADPHQTISSAANILLNVLEGVRLKAPKCRVFNAVSSECFGETLDYVATENTKLNPKSFYGKTKIENEKIANEYYNKFKILSIGIRFSNIYGKYQRYDSLYSAVITKWINLIKYKKPVIFHDNKNILRDFCHVNDVVSSIKLSYKYIEKREKADLFNIAYGRSISLKILFKNILKFLQKKDKNMKPEIKLAKTPKENIIVSKISIEKAKIKLNYKPKISIIQGLCLSFK